MKEKIDGRVFNVNSQKYKVYLLFKKGVGCDEIVTQTQVPIKLVKFYLREFNRNTNQTFDEELNK